MSQSSLPKFIFAVLGTRGDVLPILAIARAMIHRGYRCHVLANESFEAEAARSGVPLTAVAPQQKNNITSIENNLRGNLFPSYEPTYEFFGQELSRSSKFVIVNVRSYCASSILAELYGLPICRIYMAPYGIRSLISPPRPFKDLCDGPLRHIARKYALPKMYLSWDTSPFLLDHINRYRTKWGLSAVQSVCHSDQWVRHNLALFPDWFCRPASDWPSPIELSGFVLPESSRRLPQEFMSFVHAQGKPLVYTPGTGVTNAGHFFQCAKECCERLGMPGVFLSPNYKTSKRECGAKIIHFDYLDLAPVLQEAALLVHHGGIGTTACALQAGVPQIISPQAYDQPDNGYRVSCLHAGCVIERSQLSGMSLASQTRRLLESSEATERLAQISGQMVRRDATKDAADCLEQAFVKTQRPTTSPMAAAGRSVTGRGSAEGRHGIPAGLLDG